MTSMPDEGGCLPQTSIDPTSAEQTAGEDAPQKALVLIVDADPALSALIGEWLSAKGCRIAVARSDSMPVLRNIDVIIVDVAFPRQGGIDALKRIAQRYPGLPIVALSSTFFAGVDRHGAIARSLGVAAVLPMPVKREALTAEVEKLIARNGSDARR